MEMARSLSQDRDEPWVRAHTALTRLARERASADAEEGRWLLAAWRSSAHVHMGCGTFAEYIERLFGYRPRTTREKLRAAEALERLPLTARALEEGAVSWSAARELSRVATEDTERAWLDAARGKTVRQLEALVSSRAPGDTPESPAQSLPRSRVLRFEVAPETFALFREAMLHLRRSTGAGVDDDAVLLSMARQILGGPGDDGRSTHQIALEICPACRSAAQLAGGELIPVDPEIAAMAECDAQHLGHGFARAANENAAPGKPGAHLRDADDVNAAHGASAPHDAPSTIGAPVNAAPQTTASPISASSTHPATSPAPTWTPPRHPVPADLPRAKQSIPPAVRRGVLLRDRRCCRVPGCRNALFVDAHHVQPRSQGGSHEADNLVALCSAHHRAVHRGELVIEAAGEGRFRFFHADGAPYGNALSPEAIDAYGKVFQALRGLGYREREVQSVLAELRADAGLSDATLQPLLLEALRRIRVSPSTKR